MSPSETGDQSVRESAHPPLATGGVAPSCGTVAASTDIQASTCVRAVCELHACLRSLEILAAVDLFPLPYRCASSAGLWCIVAITTHGTPSRVTGSVVRSLRGETWPTQAATRTSQRLPTYALSLRLLISMIMSQFVFSSGCYVCSHVGSPHRGNATGRLYSRGAHLDIADVLVAL